MNNLTKRILIGAAGIPLIIVCAYFGGIYFLLFSLIVSSIALLEFCEMFGNKNFFPLKSAGVIINLLIILANYFNISSFIVTAVLLIPVAGAAEIFRKGKNPLNALILCSGILYITIPFVLLNSLLRMTSYNAVILIFVLIWTCDTAAYFAGKKFGRHKLTEISPNKTVEGAIAGFFFTVLVSLILHFVIYDKQSFADAVALGVIAGLFAQAGDLFESMIKRFCEVKDSSNIIPGHGGALDRFDSLIFVAPAAYFYFAVT